MGQLLNFLFISLIGCVGKKEFL